MPDRTEMEQNDPLASFCRDTLLPLYQTYYQPEKRAAVQAANRQFWLMLLLTVGAPILAAAYFTSYLTAFYFFILLLCLTELLYLSDIGKIYGETRFWTIGIVVILNSLVLIVGYINFSETIQFSEVFSASEPSSTTRPDFNVLTLVIFVLTFFSLSVAYQSDNFKNFLRVDYKAFKNQALGLFFQQFYPGFSLFNGRYFDRTTLDSTEFFDRIDELNEEDVIQGSVDGHKVVFAEMTLVKITKTDKQTYRSTIFKGLMVEMQLSWAPAHRVMLKKEPGWSPLDLFVEEGREVKMEDTEFEKRFQVLSADKLEVYRILSPQAMQDLVALNRQYPDMPGLCFSANGLLSFALPMRDDLFEVEIDKGMEEVATRFAAVYRVMQQVTQVCEDLVDLRMS